MWGVAVLFGLYDLYSVGVVSSGNCIVGISRMLTSLMSSLGSVMHNVWSMTVQLLFLTASPNGFHLRRSNACFEIRVSVVVVLIILFPNV